MNLKKIKKMKIKLDGKDILEITKALKGGWLDTGKITMFQSLLDGYNPPKAITQGELDYYLDCLYKGMGYVPYPQENVDELMYKAVDDGLLDRWNDGYYKKLVRNVFMGMLAMRGMGGVIVDKEHDFSFLGHPIPR